MALTRKYLSGLGITPEQVEAIIEAHAETTEALKAQRDTYKADAERLSKVQTELNEMKDNQQNSEDWQKKYEKEHSDFEAYKTDIQTRDTKRQKEQAYRNLLKTAGVDEKRFDTVLKVTPLTDCEINEDGQLKNSEELLSQIKEEWSDFIVETETHGADTKTPPDAGGGNTMTKEQIMAIKDTAERQKAMKDNHELFGI